LRGTILIVDGTYERLGGAIRLGLALNTLIQKYQLYLLCATYFGAVVVDVTVFTIVVAVAEFDGWRLHHRKEHCLALLLVPHFCL
jgi:hypothetical protein